MSYMEIGAEHVAILLIVTRLRTDRIGTKCFQVLLFIGNLKENVHHAIQILEQVEF